MKIQIQSRINRCKRIIKKIELLENQILKLKGDVVDLLKTKDMPRGPSSGRT